MTAINLNDLPLQEFLTDANPRQRTRATFPFLGSEENKDTSLVYFELEPGYELGSHTDSAEEILLIMEGTVEVIVGDETSIVTGPSLALVPEMIAHNLRNIGDEKVKVAGFFPSRYLVATFENGWGPNGDQVVDTQAVEAMMVAA